MTSLHVDDVITAAGNKDFRASPNCRESDPNIRRLLENTDRLEELRILDTFR